MKIKLFLSFILLNYVALAQPTHQQWVARYSGLVIDEAKMVKADNSGNVYVTGRSIGSGSGYDFLTVKYNSAGVQQWEARYNGPANNLDEAVALALDNQGNVLVAGSSASSTNGFDYCVVKYNSSGTQLWVARYNDSVNNRDDIVTSMVVSDSGNVYLTGYSFYSPTNYRWLTIKYNSAGVIQWILNYTQGGFESAREIAVDVNGNIYVAGGAWNPGINGTRAVVQKINSAGVSQWVSQYDYAENTSVAYDISGNVYTCGFQGTGSGRNYLTLKYNSAGFQQWVKTHNGSANDTDIARKVRLGAAGDIYVTGTSKNTTGGNDIVTIKYDGNGNQLWLNTYNGLANGRDAAADLFVDFMGNAYVTGFTDSSANNLNYITLKYNFSGTQIWSFQYNGPGNGSDMASSVFVDVNHNVYVTGASFDATSNIDYATIKYSQLVGIVPINNEIPNQFSLFQNYPNPFNPNTKFKVHISKLSDVKIVVFDALRREIETLVNEQLNPGTYEVEFDGSRYSSGIYFYKLVAGEPLVSSEQGFIETKKMLLVK